jgi:hypothetical protein
MPLASALSFTDLLAALFGINQTVLPQMCQVWLIRVDLLRNQPTHVGKKNHVTTKYVKCTAKTNTW